MLVFENDYSEGAHPLVLKKLLETNMEKLSGYGNDRYTEEAREKIRKAVGKEDADVFFIAGGTQTNLVIISTMLKRYEGAIAAVTGHVNGHEAGAIEYTGHKVMTLPHHDGKIDPEELDEMVSGFYKDANHEHMVFPGMVYVSHPTEYGTLYSDKELTAISEICHRYDIPLFLDGARLGYALACPDSDLTLERIAELADVFYIGGTKVGALCGEAVVFTRKTPEHFLTMTKGYGIINHSFLDYRPMEGDSVGERQLGVLVSIDTGQTTAYALGGVEDRGVMFVGPGVDVYEGMIVGEHSRDNDLVVNVTKGKQLTNTRSSTKDSTVVLKKPRVFNLEACLDYINDDELVEVTPKNIRLRKRLLTENERRKAYTKKMNG